MTSFGRARPPTVTGSFRFDGRVSAPITSCACAAAPLFICRLRRIGLKGTSSIGRVMSSSRLPSKPLTLCSAFPSDTPISRQRMTCSRSVSGLCGLASPADRNSSTDAKSSIYVGAVAPRLRSTWRDCAGDSAGFAMLYSPVFPVFLGFPKIPDRTVFLFLPSNLASSALSGAVIASI